MTHLSLRPYPAYRDSGLDWLGPVPAHWEIRRHKRYLREVDERSGTGREPLLSMRKVGLVRADSVSDKEQDSALLAKYKKAAPQHIVMNPMQAGNGMFAQPNTAGLVSPDYRVFELTAPADPRYLTALFKTSHLRRLFRIASKGLGTGTAGFLRLYPAAFGCIRSPFPPLAEQRRIADFLDAYTRQVQRLLVVKRRSVAALIERRQGVVTSYLQNGFDGSASSTRDIAWLEQRPAAWETARLKRLATNQSAKATTEVFSLCVALERVEASTGRLLGALDYLAPFSGKGFETGDVLFGKLRPYLAKVVQASFDGVAGSELLVLRPQPAVSSRFLSEMLRSKLFIAYLSGMTNGAKMPRVEWETLADLRLPLPPLQEQQAICSAIDRETGDVERAIDLETRAMTLIEEYRAALVAVVVTGQLDVRTAEIASTDGPLPSLAKLEPENALEPA